MKKLLLLAALFVGTLSAFADAADDYVSGSLKVASDCNSADLTVALNNSVSYVAFQMDITFAEDLSDLSDDALTFVAGRDNSGTTTINGSSTSTSFVIAKNWVSKNTLRVVAYNLGNVAIAGNSGDDLLTVKIVNGSDGDVSNVSEWTAEFSNVIFVTTDDLAEIEMSLKAADGTATTPVSTLTGEVAESWIMGDVNHDGAVNVNDITATIKKTLSKEVDPFYEAQADVNSDGTINVNDVTGIIKLSLGKSL